MNTLTLESARANKRQRTEQTVTAAATYAEFTVSTAKYPTEIAQLAGNVSAAVLYTSIGLSNEVGELAELFDAEALREEFRAERYAKAWKELGDVQWYAARLCAEMPELPTFESMVQAAMLRLDSQDFRELRVSGFDLQSALCAHSGRVLGVVKKMMRDGAEWTAEKRAEKIAEMREHLQAVVSISVEFAERTGPLVGCEGGYVNVLRANADKLSDRKDRGVLKGDGDSR